MSEDVPHYGPMTEQRAREILELGPDDGLIDCWCVYFLRGDHIGIDGGISVDTVEAIAWWMRNKAPSST